MWSDSRGRIWVSEWNVGQLGLYDPAANACDVFALPSASANVRQILGRPGEVWGAESGADKLVVIRSP